MFYNLINKLDNKFCFSTVAAHCDIPCKIYDPITAQFWQCKSVETFDANCPYPSEQKLVYPVLSK